MAPAIMPPFAPAESPLDDTALGVSAADVVVAAVPVVVAAGPVFVTVRPVIGAAAPVQMKDPIMPLLT